jgi:hypothetical protein
VHAPPHCSECDWSNIDRQALLLQIHLCLRSEENFEIKSQSQKLEVQNMLEFSLKLYFIRYLKVFLYHGKYISTQAAPAPQEAGLTLT